MAYSIEYTGFCMKGLVRKKNEDNLFCGEKYLPIIHTDNKDAMTGTFSTDERKHFAVFDGMGGESCGEVASFIAAEKFAEIRKSSWIGVKESMAGMVHDMNEAICDYARKNHIHKIGSTVATLFFYEEGICGFNVGDSRCYRFSEGKLELLSVDHVVSGVEKYNGFLTQCLGIPEKWCRIVPSVYTVPYKEGDIFLLCTDGLTKMISDRRIALILKENLSLQEKLQKMNDIVLMKGAVDNTTVILTETSVLRKTISGFFRKFVSWLKAEI